MARKSECTAQCGLGYRTLEIYCAKISHEDGKMEKVDDRFCSGQHKPENKEGCHGDCNPGGWEYSPWSEVGGGKLERLCHRLHAHTHVCWRFRAAVLQELWGGHPSKRGSVSESSRD